jgi:exonuclease III
MNNLYNNNISQPYSFNQSSSQMFNTTSPPLLTNKTYNKNRLTDILKIATINVKTLTAVKQQFLIDLMNTKHFTILGLSETNLPNKQAKFLYQHEKNNFVTYFNNDDSFMGKGVGIIIRKNYAQHIVKHGSYKGRILYVDFIFKGKNKVRIIQYYGKSGSHTIKIKKEIEDLHQHLTSIIREGKQMNSEIILMGDFNLNYEDYTD